MEVAALVLYVVWFVLAFGLRTLIAVRRTGDAGWRGLSGRPFSLEWSAGVLFGVALAIGVAAPVAGLLGMPTLVTSSTLEWIGLATAAAGVLMTLAAQMSMGDSWRIGVDESERTELVTAGAFQLARNPIFTAMGVTAAGLTMMVPNALAVVGLLALVVALQLQVRGVEEPYLRATHGANYAAYASRVGRFVPQVGRLH
ncbi:MAG: methyltransferase family protein [Ilumatobacteraceae bacterium]